MAAYDAVESLDAATPSALIDIAGDAAVAQRVGAHRGNALRLNMVVGATHWQARGAFGGKARTGFFAPARMAKRSANWGREALAARIGAAWRGFMADARRLTAVETRSGADAALATYRAVVGGHVDPRGGIVIALPWHRLP
jgi:hypothetical protein